MITCRPQVQYDKKVYSLYETRDVALRDLGKEAAVREVIQRYGEAYDERQKAMVITDEDKIYDLLTEGIPVFQQLGEVYISDTLKGVQVHPSPKVAVGVSIDSGRMQLKMTAGEMSKEELIDILSRYNKRKKYYRLKDGSFVQKEDSGLDILADLKETLQLTDQQLMQESVPVDTYRALYIDQQLRDNPVISSVRDKNFRSLIRNMKTVEDNDFEIPAELEPILRGYQKTGFLWLKTLSANGFGGILADDMGLGKTVQVIALLNQMKQENQKEFDSKPSIIVVPKSLISNWESEFKHFAPEFDLFVYYGADRNIEEISKHQIIITTYAVTRIDIEKLQDIEFNFAILDEIQAIKNTASQVTKAVMLLNTKHRFGLSGTPMENHLGELYSIFRFINPPMFGSVNDFNEKYLNPIQKDGDQQVAKQLSSKLNPFILRRLKKEVAKELPEKTEQILYVELSDEQRTLYESRRQYFEKVISKELEGQKGKEGLGNAGFVVLQGLTELRQLASCPESKSDGQIQSSKWDVLISGLTELAENGHKCLVFTNFISCIESISQKLEENGIEHLVMTGATNNRAEIVKKFKNDSRYKVFLMTLKTGGVGLNLTEADYVYIIDPWWNTSAEQQAVDRTHRIGQNKNVFCYRMIAKNTIEKKILELQNKKKDLFAQVISSDTQLMKKLTVEDIDYLLKK